MPKIVYIDPESEQEVSVELSDQLPEITIGRNPGNVVRVNNPSISRQHARVVYESGQCTLVDLDSSNGSYINGNRIRSQVLVDGDRIRVGEFPVDYIAQMDEATYEVDREVIDELQREMQSPPNGDVRRQTAMGGFGADPASEDGWGAPDYLGQSFDEGPGNEFDFVEESAIEAESGPVSLSMDLIEEVPDSQEFGVDDDAILEELVVEELVDESLGSDASDAHQDTYNAPPDEIAHSLRALDRMADSEFKHEATVESDVVAAAAAVMSLSPAEPQGIPALPGSGELVFDLDDELEEIDPFGDLAEEISDDVPDEIHEISDLPEEIPELPEEVAGPDEQTREVADGDLDERLQEAIRERDELRSLIDGRASGAEGASQVQIERLRSERDRLIEERRNLKRQIGDLQREVSDAPSASELEAALIEINEANDRITALEVQVEDVRNELAERTNQVESLESERQMLRAELGEAEALAEQGASLGEQLANAKGAAASSQSDLQSAIDRVATLETDLANSQNEVRQLVGDVESRDSRVAELEAEFADASHALVERDNALETMNEEVEASRITIADLEGKVDHLETELAGRPIADEVTQMHQDLIEARASVETLTTERDELLSTRSQLEADLNEARQLYDTLESRHSEIGAKLEAASDERDALKHEKGAFARETDYLQVEKRKLDSELRGLRKQVKELTKADKRKKQVFSELSGDLKKLVGENNELQKMIEDLDGQLRGAPSSDDLAAAESRAAELETETTTLRATVEELEGDTAALTRELGSLGEERDQLRGDLERVRAEVETANAALEALRENATEGESATARVVELEVAVENLTHELEQAKLASEEATKKADEATAEAKKAEAEAKSAITKTEKDAEKLKKKLSDAENALAEVILEKDRLEDELKSKG